MDTKPADNRLTVVLAVAVGVLAVLVIILAVAVITEDESDDATATTTTEAPSAAEVAGVVADENIIVFMQPNATEAQIDDVRALLDDDERIEELVYCDQDCAHEEFQELFADDPDAPEVAPGLLPPSFRVELVDGDDAHAVGDPLDREPGVREVAYPPN
jgi:hypothetical protein